ncbi:MAG: 1-acyl-sn-glycerol-3-phosphate acyltransferase [Acholeplasmataceae bacterium]|nr:1-acyl-sn-glycerol-3-phosphate acyltransferase [Acholeplasmataceae bacterium]
MISAIFIILSIAFTYGLHLIINLSYYYILLWIIPGVILGLIFTVLFILVQIPLLTRTKLFNRYKIYLYRSVAYFLNRYIFRLRLEIVGRENIPKTGRLTVYANHKSYADPVVIMEAVTRPTSYTPKSGVYKYPFMHGMLRSIGAFPIDRSSDRNTARAMVEAIKVVKQGMAMVIFPEGGIKDRNDIKMVAMRAGAYRLGVKAEADMLPISIDGTTMIKHNLPFKRTKIKVTIHELIKYEDVKGLKTSDLADKVFHIINDSLTKND